MTSKRFRFILIAILLPLLFIVIHRVEFVFAAPPEIHPPEIHPPEINSPEVNPPQLKGKNGNFSEPSGFQENITHNNRVQLDFTNGDRSINFIHQEIIRNLKSEEFKKMKEDWSHWYTRPIALYRFYQMVKTNGPWDHKPQLQKLLGLKEQGGNYHYPIRGDNEHEYAYDLYSNIHYAYIGRAIGMPEWLLTKAANAHLPGVGRKDPGDDISVQIGYDLYDKHKDNPGEITPEEIRKAILAKRKDYEKVMDETWQMKKIEDGR
ncbi:polymorphic toxin type 44 domain-containing protein [Polycladomyces subterraneus]|uniref:Polymorphic toxin type 44 domain-containing protein n=1 Tax=Polycladomyces subterraneus TaxID=1016997 RepID=A0ABT8ILF0_9BACL|nr:polymorphic toxin type 44 domain-containing protein [Polycladomyces subterraneus]MDN4593530.1 polymorphic toxin type 44 domain-containing protein [Polycladomyces subterraneus]